MATPRGRGSQNKSRSTATTISKPLPPSLSIRPLLPRENQSSIQDAIQIIEAFVRDSCDSVRVQDAWKRVKSSVFKSASNTPKNDIYEVKEQIKELTSVVRSLARPSTPLPTSYAAIAKTGLFSSTEARIPVRLHREITIRPGQESTEQKARSGADIVRDATTSIGAPGVVIAARRLNSGDVVISFDSAKSKEHWETRPELRAIFGAEANTLKKGHLVLVHRVRTAELSKLDLPALGQTIIEQNPKWNGHINIVRLAWTAKTRRVRPEFGTLLVSVATPTQANLMIRDGVLLNGEYYNCEVFSENCQVTRCFKCQLYHRTNARFCRNEARCGFCAGTHETKDCLAKDQKGMMACRPCGKVGHCSWSKDCPSWAREAQRAKDAYLVRPLRYQEHTTAQKSASTFTFASSEAATTSTTPTSSSGSIQEPDFQIVRPRKRGRPSNLEVAARTNQAISSLFQATPNALLPAMSSSTIDSSCTTINE